MLAVERLSRRINSAGIPYVIAVTGGGSGVISQLQTLPGASQAFLDAYVPYHQNALINFLGCVPDKYCSSSTARMMAMRAYERACKFAKSNSVVGLACTASLASITPKKGDHRFHIAYHSDKANACYSITLNKGKRQRIEEEAVLAIELLRVLAQAINVSCEDTDSRLFESELEGVIVEECKTPSQEWVDVMLNNQPISCYNCELTKQNDIPTIIASTTDDIKYKTKLKCALFSGSFNPLHQGHIEMKRTAEELLALPVAYEISITNVDKPPLGYLDLAERLVQFSPKDHVVFTQLPRFVDKAIALPNSIFIVGLDTWLRIGMRSTATDEIKILNDTGSRFLVFGRYNSVKQKFEVMGDYKDKVPDDLCKISIEVTEKQFRADISSTEIRQRK